MSENEIRLTKNSYREIENKDSDYEYNPLSEYGLSKNACILLNEYKITDLMELYNTNFVSLLKNTDITKPTLEAVQEILEFIKQHQMVEKWINL